MQVVFAGIAVLSMLASIWLWRKIRRELDELKVRRADLLKIENRLRAFRQSDPRVGDSNRNFREGEL